MGAEPSVELSTEEKRFLHLLPGSGEAIGNTNLRRELSIQEDDYWRIRDSLVARGLVGVGRGRGGSTFRVDIGESAPAASDLDEEDLPGSSVTLPWDVGNEDREFKKSKVATFNLRPIIKSIEVSNFKRIAKASVDLTPVTILVGGNNSGKSSFLQAIHTAVSCAQESQLQGRAVVSEANLRYSPAHDFALLGHDLPYENRSAGSRGVVKFSGQGADDHEQLAEYAIEMYKGANHKNVGVERKGVSAGFGRVISDPANLFSVYVPGLSGVLLNEESHGYASLFMRAARGDANLVFRNIIERLVLDNKRQKLEGYLSQVFGYPVSLQINSKPERDMYVDVRMAKGQSPTESDFLPVELWGMGVLQVTQLLAYVLLFEPDILLVDEPDSHVHPSSQKMLMVALGRIASETNCRIIVSTHSRHVVSSAPDGTAIVWMKDGEIVDYADDDIIPLLIDLGALDQFDLKADVLLATEDEDSDMLKGVVSQLSGKSRVEFVSFNGLNNATNAQAFKTVSKLVEHGPKVVIHRDRDFLTDEELEKWSQEYVENGIAVFCPKYCDVEYYFATAKHIAAVTGMTLEDAELLRIKVIEESSDALLKKFENKRKYANEKLWPSGGSPANDSLWNGVDPIPEQYIYGKGLLTSLKKELRRDPIYRNAPALDDVTSQELTEELRSFFTQTS
ncbi:ATP-dependent nuclease [Glutamicibacter ardleyensis]|uniref:ATP-dependent nuclease n=1 Tax=Glutamicibacter ardleyensis TaxID=225894 RepID=UPI003FD0B1B7